MSGKALDRSLSPAGRAARAWEMRVDGASWSQVADALGYSHPANARRAAMNALDQVVAEDEREVWVHRLEGLYRRLDEMVTTTGSVPAARVMVQLVGRVAALRGLDSPPPAAAARAGIEPDARWCGLRLDEYLGRGGTLLPTYQEQIDPDVLARLRGMYAAHPPLTVQQIAAARREQEERGLGW